MKLSIKLAVTATATAAALAALFAGPAFGSPGGHDRSVGEIKVTAPCTAAQAHANQGRGVLGEHGDAFYRCRETSPGCFQWKWQYDGRPKSGRSWPPRSCVACSPVPSRSAGGRPSKSPAVSKAPSGSVTTAGAPATTSVTTPPAQQGATTTAGPAELPVTGTGTAAWLLILGCALIAAGAVALIAGHRRNNP